ncbi:MAG: hypothetical protein FWD72_03365, partial [Eggerthellaceae bacterium]|nr:hypothetical protein [Eggerthellaceae bacterium]
VRLTDPELLAHVALCTNMHNIQLACLSRLLEIGKAERLPTKAVEELLALLNDGATVVTVIELAQLCGIDWAPLCSTATIHALFEAHSEGKGWQRDQAIEKSVRQVFEARPDLKEVLLSYQWVSPYTDSTISFS